MDTENIVTPVNAKVFGELLMKADYPRDRIKYLVDGFTKGFPLHYEGPKNIKQRAANLKFRIGNKTEMWNKIMKEVKELRVAGPFEEIPFDNYIQFPIGLVLKDGGKKTRLIFHLSHPRKEEGYSVNGNIPKDKCKVKYPDFDDAVRLCLKAGKGCKIGKSDMSSAFRHLPMLRNCWRFLVMMAQDPKSGKDYFFFDKCLPFGSSISCAHFQAVSDAIAAIVEYRNKRETINYLDDFFFAALLKLLCDKQIQGFLDVCDEIQFPVAMEKTFWGTTVLVFLGLLLDTERQLVCIPVEKIDKAFEMIEFFIDRSHKKVTVLQLQQLCGYLNFLCRSIVPGQAFTMRLYSLLSGKCSKLQPHHHLKLKEENCLDLQVWKTFLLTPQAFCRPFMELGDLQASEIQMYSDASGKIGFGALCGTSWTFGEWDKDFLKQEPSIEYLELFAVAVGILNWIHRFKNRNIILFCDNISAVHMINNSSAHCKNCMLLIRLIVLESLKFNVKVMAKYVNTKDNGLADSLSRLNFKHFWMLGPNMEKVPTSPPVELWPIWKVWMKKD